jgi:hypothetical protein
MMQADDEDSSDFDDEDFLGGFSPQDESTPLNVARVSNAAERQLVVSPSRPPPVVTSPSSTESRKRKRQSGAVNDEHVELASPSSRSSSLSTLTPAPESPVAETSDELPSFTMATPMSSSTASPIRLITVERQTAATTDKNAAAKPLPKVTTLSLQTRFLPQRRIRRRQQTGGSDDEEDINSANVDSDEDELTREIMRRPQRPRKKGLSNASSGKTNAKLSKSNRGGKKNTKATGNAVDSQTSKSQRTYSRQAADKENDYLSDNSSGLSSPPPSEDLDSGTELPSHASKNLRVGSRELQAAARKFAEVDQWEMEFEDVSYSESSPMR